MKKITLLFLIFISMISCDKDIVYSHYISLDKGWNKDHLIEFHFEEQDTLSQKNLFIMLRNNQEYPYSNIFLITKMQMPNDKIVVDTLEYQMANPDGSWLGYGLAGNKESKLWYKEKITFPVSGEYKFSISQAMRKVGDVEGDQVLKGIKEVGLQIENVKNQ